jgi:hypothetical protein
MLEAVNAAGTEALYLKDHTRRPGLCSAEAHLIIKEL